ncbi:unnamed protein product [Gongylonema pulchrum]|uniref:Orthodenticle n=1 Tax=Gongylonema pulchrum TaxID=637853 RepID=A0A183DGB5_9BILA|nr:unnamed protein product [Gongylonema pulchrum]
MPLPNNEYTIYKINLLFINFSSVSGERKEDSDVSSDDGLCSSKQHQQQPQQPPHMMLNPAMAMPPTVQDTNCLAAAAYSNQLAAAASTNPCFNFAYNTHPSMQYIPSADMLHMTTSYQSL